MGTYFAIAARNLMKARRRTFLLSLALSLVTMLLVVLLSLSQGLTENMVRSATTLSAGHINVGGFFKTTESDVAPILTDAKAIEAIVRENTPNLDYVIDRHRGWAKVISETDSTYAGLSGITPSRETRLLKSLQLAEEREYKEGGREEVVGELHRIGEPNTALLFVNQAKRLGVGVGDTLTLTAQSLRGSSNSADVTVVAVARDIGLLSLWNIIVSKETLLGLYQLRPETTGVVMVYLKDIRAAEEVMGHLRGVFEAKGFPVMDHEAEPFFRKFETVLGEAWTGGKLDLTIWNDEISFLNWIATAFDAISLTLIGLLLVIIVVGIMNTMWISVRERTGEVGTLRAIGMHRSQVLWMFLTEAVLLGLGATMAGGILGGIFAYTIDAIAIPLPIDAVRTVLLSDTLHLSVHLNHIVISIASFTVVTALSALWPAALAARMQPVTAIHHLG